MSRKPDSMAGIRPAPIPVSGWTPWLFILPALLVYLLFVLIPMGTSFGMSLFHWEGASARPVFCGLSNFSRLPKDPVFWRAILHNILLLVGSLAIQLPIAAGLALLLYYPLRGRSIFRTAFVSPMVIPTAAVAILWQYIYAPENGMLTSLIRLIRPDFEYAWLATPGISLFWIFVVICWQYIGFHCVLFMAALTAVPQSCIDAARLDGASEWQICRHLLIPLMKPMARVSVILSVVGSLKYFDLIYLMAGGLPAENREVAATYIYRLAFDYSQGRFGYASACAVVLFLLALGVTIAIHSSSEPAGGTP